MGPMPGELTEVLERGHAEGPTRDKLGGPPGGVHILLGIEGWAECTMEGNRRGAT